MIKIAICDDNIMELNNIVELINEYRLSKNLNCEYTIFQSGFELVSAIEFNKQSFDIYFLDIVMPVLTGIDVAKTIRRLDKSANIIFSTCSTEFALESYSVRATNYLLKPLVQDNFFAAFDELLDRMEMEQEACLIVKSNIGIEKILISNIVYAEIVRKKVFYYLVSGKVVESKQIFYDVCNTLMNFPSYIKPHRSYIINMMYIDSIDALEITMQTGSIIPLSRDKTKEIKTTYLDYQLEE